MSNTVYDIIVANEYEQGGETKTSYTNVGAGFPNSKDGFNLEIKPGIAISGRVILMPRKPKD
ncbi:MAG: hypothetical protein AAF296_02970 [Pseudomonadota bacterium]